ncbi:hypothetical protein pb186bvf_003798 [Paramecium bursaria]
MDLTRLIEEGQKYREIYDKMVFEETVYLLSTKWLESWKRRVGFDNQQPTSEKVGAINEDIGCKVRQVLFYLPQDSHPWNGHLKEDKQVDQDFILISTQVWKYFSQKYQYAFALIRERFFDINNQPFYNFHYKKIRFIAMYPQLLMNLKMHNKDLLDYHQLVPSNVQVKLFVQNLTNAIKICNPPFSQSNPIRLYILPKDYTYEKLKAFINSQIMGTNNEFSFPFPDAKYVEADALISDLEIENEQIMLMDAQQVMENWIIQNDRFPKLQKCSGCRNYRELTVVCICKKAFYCEENCRIRDENYHQQNCIDESDQSLLKLKKNKFSKLGLVGLSNLGNTCYMNSALQCLSHTELLSRYFLDLSFKLEINIDNPLGSKGKLVNGFAQLLRRLWLDNKSIYSPRLFKNIIGEIQQQFQGNNQHDAQEFLTFLLDQLHEDLNRITKKPYIEIPDNDNRPDIEVSKEQWDIFRKRNNSHIIDTLYGLYKSQLKCPTCDRISITFDPFAMVSVSIPQVAEKLKQLKIQVIQDDNIWLSKEETYEFDKFAGLKFKDIVPHIGLDPDQVIMTCSNNFSYEEVFIDEMLHVLKKKLKYKKLFLRKLTSYEQSITLDDRIQVILNNVFNQQGTYQWKKQINESQNIYFSKMTTYNDIHEELFKLLLPVVKQFQDFTEAWLLEPQTLRHNIYGHYYTLEFKSNQKYNQDCSYCGKSLCNDCQIPQSDNLFGECLERGDKLLQPEIQIIWLKPFKFRMEDLYEDFLKANNRVITTTNTYEVKKNKAGTFTLQQCLEYSSKPEQLGVDNLWYCGTCKDHVQAFKTLQIYQAPKILIFHLKRFRDTYRLFKSKLTSKVEFPFILDLKEFLLNYNLPGEIVQQDTVFELYAVSNHIGGLGGGHYTAFCKNQNQWWKFDDNYLNKISSFDVVTENAYVLFYIRKGIPDDYDFEKICQQNEILLKDVLIEEQQIANQEPKIINQSNQQPEKMQLEPVNINEVIQEENEYDDPNDQNIYFVGNTQDENPANDIEMDNLNS